MAQAPTVVVIGAGIVGVLTAYALAKQGKSVHVIDRARAPAEVCRFGNAGVLAVGHAKAWAGPAALASIARAVLGCEPGVRVTRLFDPALWRWGAEFLGHCSKGAHDLNSAKLQSLMDMRKLVVLSNLMTVVWKFSLTRTQDQAIQ